MPRETASVRATRLDRRRSEILDAATDAFADRGFARTRIAAIARGAGVADGTIYNYFADKNELLIALLERLHAAERRKIDFGSRPPADLGEFLEAYFRQRLDVLWQHRRLVRAVLPHLLIDRPMRERYRVEVLEPMLAQGVRMFDGLVASGQARRLSPERVVRAVSSLVLGSVLLALLEERRPDARLPEHLAGLVLDGISRR